MRTMWRCSALAGLLLVGSSALWAQHPQVRKGFWIGFGIGYGSLHATCDNCSDSTVGSVSGRLRLGGTLRPNLLLGGDIVGWSKDEGTLTDYAGGTSAAVYWYPMETGGFFLKGGAGFSYFSESGGGVASSGTGFGFIVGAGYDVRVGRNISITPVGNFLWGSVGDINTPFGTAFGWKQTLLDVGLDVTFH